MTIARTVGFLLLITGCSLIAGCFAHHGPEAPKEEEVTVQAVPVKEASFEHTVRAVGVSSTLPGRQALVSSAVDGLVEEILISLGERVKAGQPLVRLDDRLAREDLEEKKLAKAEAEASLALLKALPREPERRAASLEVERAKVATDLAREAIARLEPLHAKKEVSEPQMYEAKQRLAEATLAGKAAEARLEVLIQGPRPEAVAEGEAKVARAAAAVNASEVRLAYFTLKAPREGRVSRVLCRLGQALKPGDIAVDVLDTAEVLITASVPIRDLAGLDEGKEARITLGGTAPGGDAEGAAFPGKVAFIGPEAIPATGAIPVGIIVSTASSPLRPGVAVSVEIVLGNVTGMLAVPEEAVVFSDKGPTVVVIRDGKSVTLPARVGLRAKGLVEVAVEGLKAGELVITAGGYDLSDGTKVLVEEKEGEKEHEKEAGKKEPEKKEAPAKETKENEPAKEEPAAAPGKGSSR